MTLKNQFYDEYKNNIFSQNGEDGILLEMLKRLNVKTGWVCEFGAWDGMYLSNTFNLIKSGFKGVLIEGDAEKYKDLEKTAKLNPNIIPINAFVGYGKGGDYLDEILDKTDIPKDFDVLSIDVDSCDYYIWKSLKNYHPKIVVIEINSAVDPNDNNWIYDPNSSKYTTTAFRPMFNLGLEKGYKFVLHTGNMVFIRNELYYPLGLEYENELDNFNYKWLGG